MANVFFLEQVQIIMKRSRLNKAYIGAFLALFSFHLMANVELKDALIDHNWLEAKKRIDDETFDPNIEMYGEGSKFAGINALHFVTRHEKIDLLNDMLNAIKKRNLSVDIDCAPAQGEEEGKTIAWYLSSMKTVPLETLRKLFSMFPNLAVNKAPKSGPHAGKSVLWNLSQKLERANGDLTIIREINDKFPSADFNAAPEGQGSTLWVIISREKRELLGEIIALKRPYNFNIQPRNYQSSTPLMMAAQKKWWPEFRIMFEAMKTNYPKSTFLDWEHVVSAAIKDKQWDVVEDVAIFLSEPELNAQAFSESATFLPLIEALQYRLAFKYLPTVVKYDRPARYLGVKELTPQQVKLFSLIYFYFYPAEITAQELRLQNSRLAADFVGMKNLFLEAVEKERTLSDAYCDAQCKRDEIYNFIVERDQDLTVMSPDEVRTIMRAFTLAKHEDLVSEKSNKIISQVLTLKNITADGEAVSSFENKPVPYREIKANLQRVVEDEIRKGLRVTLIDDVMMTLVGRMVTLSPFNEDSVKKLFEEVFEKSTQQ